MIILTLRTDKPEAEVGLFDGNTKIAYEQWHAHRELSATLHQKIEALLKANAKTWQDVDGIVGFEGPGSFTGLRIGLSVANALAYSLKIPVVAAGGDNWMQEGTARLQKGETDPVALPQYGNATITTLPRK